MFGPYDCNLFFPFLTCAVTYPRASCNGSNLRVQVSGVGELLNDEVTQVVQQRVLVNCVLHLWHPLQEHHAERSHLAQKPINHEHISPNTQTSDIECSRLSIVMYTLFLDFNSQSTTQGHLGTNVPVHINHKHSYEEKEYFLCKILLFFYFKHYNVWQFYILH